MKNLSILVLSACDERQLSMRGELRETANIVIGTPPNAFDKAPAGAEVIFNWSGSLSLIREVFLMSHAARWVHSRSAGLERTLFPELIASDVTMTNGSGVFSPSLGEFALAAILYFAKDFRRMIRNQMAGVWEQFDVLPIAGQTVGIVGYGDIGRAVATRVRAVGMNVLAVKRHVSQKNPDPLVEQVYSPDHLIEMLPRCDYLLVAVPVKAERRGLVRETGVRAMQRNA